MNLNIIDTIKSRLGGSNLQDQDLSKIITLVEEYAKEGKGVQEIINLVCKKMGCETNDSSINESIKYNKDVLVRESSLLNERINKLIKCGGDKKEINALKRDRRRVFQKLKALQ